MIKKELTSQHKWNRKNRNAFIVGKTHKKYYENPNVNQVSTRTIVKSVNK